jgi:peptidoglycan hydrolase-like protein with peptidoglycan-binding domain
MTRFPAPSNRTPARLGVVGLVTIALLLSLPARGFAAEQDAQTERGESFATALHSAGLLARGAGYGTPSGSPVVRGLQRRLTELGHEPGPIDGLLGPLTEGAIMRLQAARGLAVDGVVGPQTKASLTGGRGERPGRASQPPANGQPADTTEPRPSARPGPSSNPRPSTQSRPAGERPTAPEPPAARDPSAAPEPPAAPETSGGIPAAYAALLGALAAGLLLYVLWAVTGRRTRRPAPEPHAETPPADGTRLNAGVACAALLGVFAAGAVGGAAFATRAAPDAAETSAPDRDVTTTEPLEAERATAAKPRRPARPRTRTKTAAPSQKAAPSRSASPSPPARSPSATESAPTAEAAAPAAPAPSATPRTRAKTHTVREGEGLWPIAEEQLAPGISNAVVARRVARIKELNRGRFASRDPNVLVEGEELKLP